ncbi:MAG TPA: response regulator transcription factor [Solirubrobacteraceae bacterium]|nr:response regulator transcription factor [Solirubrobacteraceae bacterium]
MSPSLTAPREPAQLDVEGDGEAPLPLRVAIMDSDSGFLAVLSNRLERLGSEHQMLAFTATPAKIAALELDVLILDLASLGVGRWDWLERLCEAKPSFGVVICTGASTVQERVRALRLGADDWLGKPCHAEELIARVESVAGARRRAEPRNLDPVTIGEVEIRPDLFQAFVAGVSLALTRREFQLIELLAAARGEILERELIYERLWGYEMARNDRSVDVFVHKLRRKLKHASPQWSYIHTQFRVGYRLRAERDGDATAPLELRPRREQPVPLAA